MTWYPRKGAGDKPTPTPITDPEPEQVKRVRKKKTED